MVSETLVLGGGLAGGASALLLARAGMPVRLLEREAAAHHKICGEFLSIEAQRHLRALDMDTARLGAVCIDRVRLVTGRTNVETALPFVALGISRKRLDEALLESAAKAGAQIERGVKVTGIYDRDIATSAGIRRADHVLLATGKHDVRGAKRAAASSDDNYVGFKMHWRPARQEREKIAGFIELILFEGGYAGLQLVAADVLNLCLIVRRRRLAELGGRWEDVLAYLMREPHVMQRLGDAEPLLPRPLTIANLPYGYVCNPASPVPDHVFRLGDQAAMTASLTGDGMAIALRSACLAVDSLLAGMSAADYHARLERQVAGQVRRAMLLQRATESSVVMAAGLGMLKLWPRLLGSLAGATRLPDWPLH